MSIPNLTSSVDRGFGWSMPVPYRSVSQFQLSLITYLPLTRSEVAGWPVHPGPVILLISFWMLHIKQLLTVFLSSRSRSPNQYSRLTSIIGWVAVFEALRYLRKNVCKCCSWHGFSQCTSKRNYHKRMDTIQSMSCHTITMVWWRNFINFITK